MYLSKKLFAPLLAIALLFSLTGCMADPAVKTPSPGSVVVPGGPSPAPIPSQSAASISFADREMRLALCTSPATVNDRASNAACYEGVLNFIISRNLIDTISPLQELSGTAEGGTQFLQGLLSDYDVFVCVGPAFCEIAALARANPGKYFILVDAAADGEADNLASVSFAEEQCGFFAGIAAAMETKTGRVAVVNGVPSDANTRYYYGFRSGVAYTNGNFGTTAEVIDLPEYSGTSASGAVLGGNFAGSAADQSIVYTMSQALIAQGCDVLFVAADAAGAGAYSAAAEHDNVWVIGAESDQFFYGSTSGERNFVLTSVTKDIAAQTEALLASAAAGDLLSGSRRLTAADDALGYVSAEGHQQLGEKTLKALADAWPMMQDGTIVPGTGPQ